MTISQAEYEKRERKKCRKKKAFETWLAAHKFAGAIWWAQKKSLILTNAITAHAGI